ncbi:rRNA maturation RNase YbeY [Candidatus Legionella polyplacis]|uniref:Endoribonuclease YbeY n=1 Tax=Candidatus Legionella polyplacis TaxID=2005262 RepID=A0ABZ2H058_9GAMM
MKKKYYIDIQYSHKNYIPIKIKTIIFWAKLILKNLIKTAEITIKFVCPNEIIQLNYLYRKKNKITNILSFPSSISTYKKLNYHFLGDIIICTKILKIESKKIAQPFKKYLAFIIIHGILHLLGFNHIKKKEKTIMKNLENKLLIKLGFKLK